VRALLGFPNPVNEKAARTVAAGVVVLSALTLITGWYWLTIPLAYGFWARVLTGPKLSPMGWTAQNLIAPRLRPTHPARPVPGPPKRFAQAMGAAMSSAALVLGLVLGLGTAADVVLGLLVVAAALESMLGLCLGCRVFALLMTLGLVPEEVCADCADISSRLARAGS